MFIEFRQPRETRAAASLIQAAFGRFEGRDHGLGYYQNTQIPPVIDAESWILEKMSL